MLARLSALSPRYVVENGFEWFDRNRLFVLQLLVVGSILFFALAVPTVAPKPLIPLITVLPVAVAGFLTLQRRRGFGLVLIILSIAIPMDGPSGSNATMALVIVLVGLWLLDVLVWKQIITVPRTPTLLPLVCLMVTAVLSFAVGQVPWYTFGQSATLGAQIGGLAIVLLSAAAFLLMVGQVRSVALLEIIVWAFLAVSAVHIAGRLVPGLGRLINPFYRNVVGESLFWMWGPVLAFSQAVFNTHLRKEVRVGLGLLALAIIFAAFTMSYGWKSGWVPAVVGVMATVGIRFWPLPLLAAPFALGSVVQVVNDLIAADEYSYGTRLDAWLIVLEITKVNPVLGLGFANYNAYTPLFPIRGYAVRFNSHSQFIDLIAQQGVVGLLCFLWFFTVVIMLGWQLRKRVPEGFPKAYVYGVLGGIVATLVAAALGDWVLPFFYNVGMSGFRSSVLSWIFMGGLVALEQIYPLQQQSQSTTPHS